MGYPVRKRSTMIKHNNKKVTLYAQSGRISIDRLAEIIVDHIKSKNTQAAKKAIKEYHNAMQLIYAEQLESIKVWDAMIARIEDEESDIQAYKKELLS